jgi:hypothetical protein
MEKERITKKILKNESAGQTRQCKGAEGGGIEEKIDFCLV